MMKHIEDHHQEKHSCENCETDFKSKADLTKHITVKHPLRDWALLVGDSHVKSVNSRYIERRLKGNRLRNPAASSPREGSSYTTTRDWPGAQFPDSNLADRVPKLLKERPYKSMVVLTPSNNIRVVLMVTHGETASCFTKIGKVSRINQFSLLCIKDRKR